MLCGCVCVCECCVGVCVLWVCVLPTLLRVSLGLCFSFHNLESFHLLKVVYRTHNSTASFNLVSTRTP